MFLAKDDPFIYKEFAGRYLVPTDTIRQQSMDTVKKYIKDMNEGKEVDLIFIATYPASRAGEIVFVSDIVKSTEPIFVVDGHHRYVASLSPDANNYPLRAIFVDREPDCNSISTYYDFLDAYTYWEKFKL